MKLLIEIGSYDGYDSLNFYNNGYEVYTFEPKKDLYENLKEKTKNLQNYHVINKAVCLNDGKTLFNISNKYGASSILPFKNNEELVKHWGNDRTDIFYSGISYEVETIRLDTFIKLNNLENRIIDYLHIDAQGVDLECLMSLGEYIKNVKEGVLETIINKEKSIYENQNLNTLENIKLFFDNNNFSITKIIENDSTNCEYNVYFINNLFK